ncbi:hypothetical protein [Candidatus Electrothrix sp.]|uniref:hypothetical protein n=1 Tax=Candidatus Electrothrix sp. TaxID=2170559 RepID=UPI0040561F66
MNSHNPYRLLNVSPEATAQEIVQASAVALRENTCSAHDIAEARKQLMHPATRRLLDFIYTVDVEPLLQDAEQGRASWADGDLSDKQV